MGKKIPPSGALEGEKKQNFTINKRIFSPIVCHFGRIQGQFQAKMADNLADKEKRCLPNKKYLSGKNHLGTIGAGDGGRTHTVSPPTDFESAQVRRTWWIFQEFQGTYFLPFFSEKAPIHDTIFDFRTYLRLEIQQTNVVEKSFSLCGQSFKNGRLKTTAFGKQRHIKNGSTQQRTFFYYLTVWRPAII